MAYMIINRETLAIFHFGGGQTEAGIIETAGRDGTESLAEAEAVLDTTPNPAEFEVVTSWEYNNRLGNLTNLKQAYENLVTANNNNRAEASRLREVIETYLKDGIEGTTDPEGFMRETEALAEAIDFEFTEEREFTMKVTFTAKVKRSQTYFDSGDFSVAVESETSEAEVIDVTDWRVTGY